MTRDRMLLYLCLAISIIALVVGSVALSRDDRDIIIDTRSKSGKVNGLKSNTHANEGDVRRRKGKTCHIIHYKGEDQGEFFTLNKHEYCALINKIEVEREAFKENIEQERSGMGGSYKVHYPPFAL